MSLTIHNLRTRCRSPKGFERHGALVDELARGPLASELRAQLGPSLDRLPAVVRLKHLNVRLRIPARHVSATTLANAWARAFTIALHRALAHPVSDGAVALQRFESEAMYRAAMLHHIATKGPAAPSWQFPELANWRNSSPAEAALGTLVEQPRLIAEIVSELHQRGWLETVLALWDDLALERLMQAVGNQDRAPGVLSLHDLVDLARAAARPGGLRSEWAFAGRRQAIRLWARLDSHFPLRDVWHALRLLLRFLEMPALLILRDPAWLADEIPFPPWCESIVKGEASRDAADTPPHSQSSASSRVSAAGALPSLFSVLEDLRPLVRSAASPLHLLQSHSGATIPVDPGRSGATVKWIVSGYAGILLMLSVVERLGLWRLVRTQEFLRFGGPRALSFLLAGIGMNLIKPGKVGDTLEPAVALLAGIFDQPDLAGLRHFFSQAGVSSVADFFPAETWDQALDLGATELARSFAGRVRGFRQASRDAVVKQFVRIHGRVLLEKSRMLVVLAPTPWAVALHLSGIDDPLAPTERMGFRRVEFVLEGL